eukprot:7923708-Pyramimonas_sp.AAC.1
MARATVRFVLTGTAGTVDALVGIVSGEPRRSPKMASNKGSGRSVSNVVYSSDSLYSGPSGQENRTLE